MFKQELPLMFPDDADLKAIQDAMFDPFEYLVLRHKDGLLKKEFPTALGKVAYHIPCHSRVQNVGQKTREALELVPGTDVKVIERCSGHAGTYGVKKEFHATAMKIGRPVFRQVAEFEPNYFSSDCALAGHHIEQGLGEDRKNAQLKHPLTLLRMAYGLPD
jgi:Fe-S oxidoreductase